MVDRVTGGSRPVISIEPLAPTPSLADPRQEAFDRLRLMALGKQFQGEILARLNDGSFLVRMADSPHDKGPDGGGATARMRLPAGVKVGAFVDLTLVAKQPRLTFQLAPSTRASPAARSDAAPTVLSSAGQLIGKLLHTARQDRAPAALVGKAPLVASPTVEAGQIATALENTLMRSGLFFESHVRQWAAGARPLAELLREPQCQAANALASATGRAAVLAGDQLPAPPASESTSRLHLRPGSAPAAQGSHSVAAPFPNKVPQDVRLEGTAERQLVAASAGQGHPALEAAAQLPLTGPESVRLITLQLEALEHRRVLWQGELWPGQPLSWEVSEQAPENDDDGAPTPSWQSTVHFSLPTLGSVSATIRLAAGHVQVQVRAATEATAHSLRLHGTELAASLEAAGLALDGLMVKQNATS